MSIGSVDIQIRRLKYKQIISICCLDEFIESEYQFRTFAVLVIY